MCRRPFSWTLFRAFAIAMVFSQTPATAAHLCLLPATVPAGVEEGRRRLVDAMVLEELGRTPIEVTPGAEVAAARRAVSGRHGNLFDPRTGSLVRGAVAAYEADLDRAMREELRCDGLVHVDVKQLVVFYANADARWDGTRRAVNDDSEGFAAWFNHFGRIGVNETGLVPVLSLWIRVTDTRGHEASFRSAGIEPLAGVTFAGGIEPIPEDEWLRDPAALRSAIQSALGPDGRWLREFGWPRGIPDRAEIPW